MRFTEPSLLPRGWKWGCVLLSSLGLFWSFPPWGYGLLVFVALIPLLLALERAATPGEAFRLATITGLLFYTANLYWLVHAMTVYGGLPWVAAFSLLLLLAFYISLYLGVFGYLWVRLRTDSALGQMILAGALWVGLEYARTYLLTGFPWGFLAYTQFANLPLLQVSSLGGLYAVSLIVVWINAALALSIPTGLPRRRPWAPLLVAGVVLAAAYVYGRVELNRPLTGTPFEVAAVQGNIDEWVKWESSYQRQTMADYRRLTETAAARGASLIVWPETAVPFVLGADPAAQAELRKLAGSVRSYLLVGSPDIAPGSPPRYFNSAFLVAPGKGIVEKYNKIHLVPFGEYVPLHKYLFFISKMVHGAVGDFHPGSRYTLFRIPQGRFGVTISYEVYFPAQVRRYFREGAAFLVNITNDAWYGKSAAPYQNLAMAVFRAVENGSYLVRSANTGISAIIDPRGRILEESPVFVPAVVSGTIRDRRGETFYTRYGDVLALLCLGVTCLFAGTQVGLVVVRLLHLRKVG